MQLDLFDSIEDKLPIPRIVHPMVLNGFYYERATDMFVSFVNGRRYYEEPASECRHLKEWQKYLKKERAI